MEVGMVPFTVTSSDPLAKLLLSFPMSLLFACQEVSVPEKGRLMYQEAQQ